MGRGIFLVNPELNETDIDAVASSELGRRTGAPEAFDSNSDLLQMSAIGDPGDDDDHDVEIFGGQLHSQYSALTAAGQVQYSDPAAFATLPTVVATANNNLAVVSVDDQLHLVVATSTDVLVYRWNGTTWTFKTSILGVLIDSAGGMAACAIGRHIYIAVAQNSGANVYLFRYSTRKNTIGIAAESFISTAAVATPYAIAMATNGATFLLLVGFNALGVMDVMPFFGGIGSMVQNATSIKDRFDVTWSAGGDIRLGGVAYNSVYGFVAAFRSGTVSPCALNLATTPDGNTWTRFKDAQGNVAQPTIALPWSNARSAGVALEGRRVFVFRGTAATLDDPTTAITEQWWSGENLWSAETAADGGIAVDATFPVIAAANHRGFIYFGWRTTVPAMAVRKCNLLSVVHNGTNGYRDFIQGEQAFVAGLDDDSQTALFFVATGGVTQGDKFRIPAAEYDYAVEHLLNDFMSQVWRGEPDDERTIQFDAGSGRAFMLDAVALFKTNFPSMTIEVDDDVGFGSPSVSQQILAYAQTPTVVSSNRNRITFADNTFVPEAYAPGLARYWAWVSTGIFRILGNTHNTLIVDGTVGSAAATPMVVYRDSMGYLFDEAKIGRYVRFTTPAIALADSYFEMARVLFGMRFVPAVDYRIEWARRYAQVQARTELKSGSRFNTRLNQTQRPAWTLSFRHTPENIQAVANFFGRAQGGVQLFGFWPDAAPVEGDVPDVYPMSFSLDPPEITDIRGGARELSVVIEGQV